MNEKIKVICIVGPTASGKTELAIKIALKVGGEIISADSMQIYKKMSIASAAPTPEEKAAVPHRLVEFLDYDESFSVADYVDAARNEINQIAASGKVPVVVGGTGLYISALADNTQFLKTDTDLKLRAEIEAEFDRIGAEEMLKKLAVIDPESAARLHPNNRRRIIRAFEVYKLSGITLTEQNRRSKTAESPYDFLMIGLNFADRAKLYERINNRVDNMLDIGLIDEAKAAYTKTSNKTDGAVQAIGHKELFPFLRGEKSLEECTENLKRATRRYAKRQITWFSADERIRWIYPDLTPDTFTEVERIIEKEEWF